MSIECKAPAASANAPVRASTKTTAGNADAAADASGASGFLALLSGLGAEVSLSDAPLTLSPDSLNPAPLTKPATDAKTDVSSSDMQALLAQMLGQGTGLTPFAVALPEAPSAPVNAAVAAVDLNSQAPTPALVPGAALDPNQALKANAAARVNGHEALMADPQAQVFSAGTLAAASAAALRGKVAAQAAAADAQAQGISTADGANGSSTTNSNPLGHTDTPRNSSLPAASEAVTRLEATLVHASQAAGSGDSREPSERRAPSHESQNENNANNLNAALGLSPSTAGASATSAPSATGAASFATEIAQQVQYWVSNDIHNAELQVDGLGSEPVQVNITMSGNEAQVVFRSDQAQTRELLGGAMAQLEQMLRGQGLALAGAWVGDNGAQQQPGANPSSVRQASVRATVAPLALASLARSSTTRAVGPGGIDCFA